MVSATCLYPSFNMIILVIFQGTLGDVGVSGNQGQPGKEVLLV